MLYHYYRLVYQNGEGKNKKYFFITNPYISRVSAILFVKEKIKIAKEGRLMSDILKDLNPEQLQAVQCINGPLLILAGAGSGKT